MSSSRRAKSRTVLALIVLATGLAGCGNGEDRSKLLSTTRASDLRSMLDGVEQQINAGDCQSATNTVLAFQQKVDALPSRLNSSLRDALLAGANRLQRLVEAQCEPAGTTGPTVQAPTETEPGPGKKGKGKAKGHKKNKKNENPEEGTPVPTVPDENPGITTP